MKKNILLLLFSIASLAAFGQAGSAAYSGVKFRVNVNDSTAYVTAAASAHTQGYADIWYSNSSDLWWVWDGSQYVNWDPSASGGGTTLYTGNGTLSSNRTVTGDAKSLTISGLSALTMSGTGNMTIGSTAGHVNLAALNEIQLIMGEDFSINGSGGTSGQVLTSNGDGVAPTWEDPTGGGATAAGATGNVQYKSNGGGLQAEAAYTYDSATNLLTVPAITAGSSTALTDGGTITITGTKHTLTSDEATITWTLSQTGDYQTTDIILNAETTTWTFPANTLCVVEGVASGNNTATVTGVTGDHQIMSIYKDGTNYRVVIKNFGQ